MKNALTSRIAYTLLGASFLIVTRANLHAEAKVLSIDPHKTDVAVETVQGPHIAVYDPQVPSRHRLLLFLTGTRGKAAGSQPIDKAFAAWGYHAISVDYENSVQAASIGHNPDHNAFGHYRQAIVAGAAVSSDIQVTPANSILNRFRSLLVYLIQNDPDGGWGEFLDHGQPVWSHVLVAGHSQGAGHAAYIGQMFDVDRVLMFSGPQDYMDDRNEPAPWQGARSATPPSRFYAFLNQQDPFHVEHQIANCMMLMHLSNPQTLMVKPGEDIHGEHHILINDFPTEQHHGSTLFPQFENVWKYMATAN